MKKTLLLVVLTACAVVGSKERPPNICNLYQFPKDMTNNDANIQNSAREILNQVWSKPFLTPETELMQKFRTRLMELFGSESYYFIRFATKFTEYAYGLVKFMDVHPPNFCLHAEVINKSVEWTQGGNAGFHPDVGPLIVASIDYNRVGKTIPMLAVGESYPTSVYDSLVCCENGYTVKFEEAWDLFGSLIPCPMTNIVQQLYESCDNRERALALTFTFIMTPPVIQNRLYWANGNIVVPLEMYMMVDKASSGPSTFQTQCREKFDGLLTRMEEIVRSTPSTECEDD